MKAPLLTAFSIAASGVLPAQVPVRPGPHWGSHPLVRKGIVDHNRSPDLRGKRFECIGLADGAGRGARSLLTFTDTAVVEQGVARFRVWPVAYHHDGSFSIDDFKLRQTARGWVAGVFHERFLHELVRSENPTRAALEGALGFITDEELSTIADRLPGDARFAVHPGRAPGEERLAVTLPGLGVTGYLRELSPAETRALEDRFRTLDRSWIAARHVLEEDAPAPELDVGPIPFAGVIEAVYHGAFEVLDERLARAGIDEPRASAAALLFLNHHEAYYAWLAAHEREPWIHGGWSVVEVGLPDENVPWSTSLPVRNEFAEAYRRLRPERAGLLTSNATTVYPTFQPGLVAFLDAYMLDGPATVARFETNLHRLVNGEPPLRSALPASPDEAALRQSERVPGPLVDSRIGVACTIPIGWERGWTSDAERRPRLRFVRGAFAAFVPYAPEIQVEHNSWPSEDPRRALPGTMRDEYADVPLTELEVGGEPALAVQVENLALVVVPDVESSWLLSLDVHDHPLDDALTEFWELVSSVRFVGPETNSATTHGGAAPVVEPESSAVDVTGVAALFDLTARAYAGDFRQCEVWLRKAVAAGTCEVVDGIDGAETRQAERCLRLGDFLADLQASAAAEAARSDARVAAGDAPLFEVRDHVRSRDLSGEAEAAYRLAAELGSDEAAQRLAAIAASRPKLSALATEQGDMPDELYEALTTPAEEPPVFVFQTSDRGGFLCGADPDDGSFRIEQLVFERIAEHVRDSLEHPRRSATGPLTEREIEFLKGQYAELVLALETYPMHFASIDEVVEAGRKAPERWEWKDWAFAELKRQREKDH